MSGAVAIVGMLAIAAIAIVFAVMQVVAKRRLVTAIREHARITQQRLDLLGVKGPDYNRDLYRVVGIEIKPRKPSE